MTTLCLLLGGGQIYLVSTHEDASDLIINELVASNGTGLQDEDGDYSDWVEIYNRGPAAVNLSGWALTDDPTQPAKWDFPDITLASDDYLVVFASGKNRRPTDTNKPLHTNFKFNRQGEFLGLYNMLEGRMMDVLEPAFPEQLRDVSHGRYGPDQTYGYLAHPTPGEPNDETQVWADMVATVSYSAESGFYDAPFTVELTTATPGATIHYTTDASEPTPEHGLVYTGSLTINSTTPLRAVAFKPGLLTSYVNTRTYLFLDEVLAQPSNPPGFPSTWGTYREDFDGIPEGAPVEADYEMDPEIVNDPRYRDVIEDSLTAIPTISIVTDIRSFNIYGATREKGVEWERPVSVELIQPDQERPGFQINAGIRIHGDAGRREFMSKHSFRLFFKGVYGATKLEYPIFPDSPVEAFDTLVLRGGVNRSYAGHIRFAPGPNTLATYTRDEWMRSSQRDMSGIGSHGIFVHLYLNGLYWGLYNVVERPDASFSAAYLGGDKEEWFARDNRYPISGSSTRFDTLIRLIDAGGLETPARYEAIKPYLDIDMFIDYMILNWYAGNADWGDKNVYIGVQNPAGQVKIYMWDSEIIWGDGADIYLGRLRRRNIPRLIFEGLIQNPDFRMKLADRMYLHLFNGGPLTDANSKARWLHINHVIEQAIIGESARWGDARYETPITQADWFNARDNVLAQMEGNADRLIRLARQEGYYPEFDPPQFNQHGGLISPGFELSMLAPTGTIYYTTDGSDPRVDGSSAVAPNAMVYELPLVPTSTTHIKARTWAGGVWSALHQVTFKITEQDRQLRLTEIMYNPADGDDYEFLELKNVGQSPLDLSGVAFSGIRYVFPAGTDQLRPGQFVVLARNPTAFKDRYPNVPITGVYDGQLSNKGEQILLVDAAGNEILSIDYDDENGWPISPDGRGDSLVLVDPNGDPTDPRNWQASTSLNGSPGADDPLFITGNPTLNAGMTP